MQCSRWHLIILCNAAAVCMMGAVYAVVLSHQFSSSSLLLRLFISPCILYARTTNCRNVWRPLELNRLNAIKLQYFSFFPFCRLFYDLNSTISWIVNGLRRPISLVIWTLSLHSTDSQPVLLLLSHLQAVHWNRTKVNHIIWFLRNVTMAAVRWWSLMLGLLVIDLDLVRSSAMTNPPKMISSSGMQKASFIPFSKTNL